MNPIEIIIWMCVGALIALIFVLIFQIIDAAKTGVYYEASECINNWEHIKLFLTHRLINTPHGFEWISNDDDI